MSTPTTLVFDLDGTLVDTAPDLLASLNAVLAAAGHRAVVPSELRHLVGHGVRTLFERAFSETGADVAPSLVDAYSADFLTYYRANIARESQVFAGVHQVLEQFKADGALLGVCTNKPHDLTELLLAALDLGRHFPVVVGAGLTPYNKPDARHVLEVIERLKGSQTRAVMIGDSPVDVAAARAAKIPVIAMSYGYTPIPVRELGADAVADSFAELPALIARLMG